jgi:predicted RecA/RadA family phage recombinase
MKVFEVKPVSDHIEIASFPAAAEKGDLIIIGHMHGFADYNTASGERGSIDIGKMAAVFKVQTTDVTGDAALNAIVYITGAGALTMTASTDAVFGTIVDMPNGTLHIVKA